jgi:hypothetical protein
MKLEGALDAFGVDPSGRAMPRRGCVHRGIHRLPAAARGGRWWPSTSATANSTTASLPATRSRSWTGRTSGGQIRPRSVLRSTSWSATSPSSRCARWPRCCGRRSVTTVNSCCSSSRSSRSVAAKSGRGGIVRDESDRQEALERGRLSWRRRPGYGGDLSLADHGSERKRGVLRACSTEATRSRSRRSRTPADEARSASSSPALPKRIAYAESFIAAAARAGMRSGPIDTDCDVDLVVAVGGDGTVLEAAHEAVGPRRAGGRSQPRDHRVPRRSRAGRTRRDGRQSRRGAIPDRRPQHDRGQAPDGTGGLGINDVVVEKIDSQRLVVLDVEVDGEPFLRHRADGWSSRLRWAPPRTRSPRADR